jgi:enamine deaminase RidA (YjgF/YER057c/UK114 family)
MMAGRIEAKLTELGIVLPRAQPPVATYVAFVRTGNLLVVSGQLPMADGKLAFVGKLGETVSLEDGQAAARQCFLNVLAHAATACDGDLDRVARVVRLGGFVACAPTFTQHPAVINGASDLAVAVFGDAGRHARAAVGVPSLPLDAAVELEAMFELA